MLTTTSFKKTGAMLLLAWLAGMLIIATPVFALDLQSAKNQGLVGETPSGYLAVVKNTPAAQALVSRINQARKEHYQAIAKRNGTSLQVVEVLAGKKAIQKAAPGHYVKSPSGSWVRK